MNLLRLALAALAALRLTRFITSDFLGEWTVVGPLKRWAINRTKVPEFGPRRDEFNAVVDAAIEAHATGGAVPTPPAQWGWRAKLVKGLDCPFCVGFWIGAAVLLGEVITRRTPLLRGVWTFTLGALGLNYVTGHISKRID